MGVRVANGITVEDVVNLLRSYRIAVLRVFVNSRLEFDFEAMQIRIVSDIRTAHKVKDGPYTKRGDLEKKSVYARIIAFTEELIERLNPDERAVLFFKYIDTVEPRTDNEVAKILRMDSRKVSTISRRALNKLRVQLQFLKLLSESL